MTDLKMAMAWLETGQYLVKHDEMSYSVRVTDFAEETDELRKVLLDALRWIPVSERLPTEELASVLVYTKDGGVSEGQYYPTIKSWKQFRWSVENATVTHWMPLPAPPRRDE